MEVNAHDPAMRRKGGADNHDYALTGSFYSFVRSKLQKMTPTNGSLGHCSNSSTCHNLPHVCHNIYRLLHSIPDIHLQLGCFILKDSIQSRLHGLKVAEIRLQTHGWRMQSHLNSIKYILLKNATFKRMERQRWRQQWHQARKLWRQLNVS